MKTLIVDSVVKSYGHHQVLSDIALRCSQGEIIGLVGCNGSGKSTLLKSIFGSIKTNAYVAINNYVLKRKTDRYQSISYLPQDNFIPDGMTVEKAFKLLCEDKSKDDLYADKFIKPLLNKRMSDLSGGERRFVEVCSIIYSNQSFCLLDEPFNHITPIMVEQVCERIKLRSDKGFIISDHNHQSFWPLADRVLLLREGNLKPVNSLEEWKAMDQHLF